MLFKIIRSYAFNQPDRDDLFQEICLQLYQSIPSFKGLSSVSTWIYRVALNTTIKWVKTSRKHDYDTLENKTFILKERKPLDDQLEWLYGEISHMNEIDRSIALLLLEGFNYKEMAEIVGISESNIGVKIHRIKKTLIQKSKKYTYHGV